MFEVECQNCNEQGNKEIFKRALFSNAWVCSESCEIDNEMSVRSHPDRCTKLNIKQLENIDQRWNQ